MLDKSFEVQGLPVLGSSAKLAASTYHARYLAMLAAEVTDLTVLGLCGVTSRRFGDIVGIEMAEGRSAGTVEGD